MRNVQLERLDVNPDQREAWSLPEDWVKELGLKKIVCHHIAGCISHSNTAITKEERPEVLSTAQPEARLCEPLAGSRV